MLVVGTWKQDVVDALPSELARLPCAPWHLSLPRQYTDHTLGMVLSAAEPMAMRVTHQPAAEVAGALPVVTIFEAMVEHLGSIPSILQDLWGIPKDEVGTYS